jgi:hypothetical protein
MTQAIWSVIQAIDATKLLSQQTWIESDGLWPADDSWSYFIDSTCAWPAWGLVGTFSTPTITRRGRVRSSESTLDDALERVGIPDQTASFLPCAAFLYRQDLIRIERSRIERGPVEKLRVFFKLGILGGTYVQGNAPRLRYELRDQDRRPHTIGELVLDAERIRDGVLIDSAESSQAAPIYSARLMLLLNGSPVDVSDTTYIRSISVRFGHG